MLSYRLGTVTTTKPQQTECATNTRFSQTSGGDGVVPEAIVQRCSALINQPTSVFECIQYIIHCLYIYLDN